MSTKPIRVTPPLPETIARSRAHQPATPPAVANPRIGSGTLAAVDEVTISSEAGRQGLDVGVGIYGAAKAGAVGLMRHVAKEVAPLGVTVNSLSLGLIGNVRSDWADRVARRVPRRRLGTPDDIGAAVAFLASDEADWITGQVLPVNGGEFTG